MMNGFLPEIERPDPGTDWMVIALLIMLGAFAVVRFFYPRQLSRISLAFGSMYEAHRLLTERNARIRQLSIILYFLVFQSIAFFYIRQNQILESEWNPLRPDLLYLILIAGIGLFIFARYQLIEWFGQLFKQGELAEKMNQVFAVNLLTLGIVFTFIDILVAFLPVSLQKVMVIGGLALLLLWAIYTVYRIFQVMNRMRVSLFYRILYLCAFEILPWWWVFEIVTKGWRSEV